MNTDKDILLAKWLQGTISEPEITTLKEHYELDEMYEMLSKQSAYDLQTVDSGQLWDNLNSKLTDQKKPNSSNSKWKYVALLLIGLLSLGIGYQFLKGDDGHKELNTPKSETATHLFADNSEVILSPGSTINYNETDWNDLRKISLEGQAFFKVVSGSPFTVHAGPGIVRVLGTEFEIWEKDGSMKVSCIEGKVEVENFSGSKRILEIGQSVSLNSANMSEITTHSLKNAEFLSGRYNFDKISIVSLVSEIERFYNVDVTLENIDSSINFSGVLLLTDIEKACSYIAETLDLKYERTLQSIRFYKE